VNAFGLFGWDVPIEILLLGVISGASYGLLAVGLVLVHRSSRVINFAHAEVGAFAATMLYVGVNQWDLPYYAVLPFALAIAAMLGTGVEGIVVGRLGRAPKVMSVVATLGVAQLLSALALAINTSSGGGFAFPSPPGMPVFDVGILRLGEDETATLVVAPIVVAALALFLSRTRAGLRVRATAANRDAAVLAGIWAGRTSRTVWALAGVLAAMTAILTAPSKGPGFAAALGPGLLLRGLAPALLARMQSLPIAFGAGIAIGVIEQVVFWNQRSTENVDLILLVLVLVALLVQRDRRSRDAGQDIWADVDTWRALPARLRSHPRVRLAGAVAVVAGVAVAVLVPLALEPSRAVTLASMTGYVVIGVGLGLITGLGGQLSLGHFAIGATAGTVSILVADRTANFLAGLAVAALVGGAVALVIGLPALRLRGSYLAVTSLAFAVAATSWLLPRDWMIGDGRTPPKPAIGATAIDSARSYYWFALAVAVVVITVVALMRRGGLGRVLIAVRDGEDVARSFGIAASYRKMQGFVVSGLVAGVGGALYAHTFASVSVASFPASASIDVAVMVVVGGATLLAGPIIGVLFVVGVPAFVPLDAAGLATTKLGLLVLLVYLPGGFAQLLLPVRDAIVRRLTGQEVAPRIGDLDEAAPIPRPAAAREPATSTVEPLQVPVGAAPVVLAAQRLSKRYGGVHAVADVSLEVRRGEIVGLIGPNGAGKTTLFELLSGFGRPDGGRVLLHGDDITRLGPTARARAGLVRSFQSSPLFPTMTVVDCLTTALEREHPTNALLAAAGRHRAERLRRERAVEFALRFGLEPFLDRRIAELSTGTRRVCELACVTALRPSVVLLDEPAAGLAQREVEALVPVLRDLRAELDCTMVVIEHDLPMLGRLSDRIVAMVTGRVVADGSIDEVCAHPEVIAAYLGESGRAVGRSGAAQVGGVQMGGVQMGGVQMGGTQMGGSAS
jgi:ABC-type branched-subunit amino acid transport system ATPase component/ABC-type branched-subunit amino acid transport system permease subunit